MPRRARLAIAGVPWHIVQRGHNRSACFYAVADYQRYLALLAAVSRQYRCDIHAYCLMTNHVHLLLTPESGSGITHMMKQLGQCYVQYVNRVYRRSGTLWEGRFRSSLIQDDDHVLACHRYIELNPVRAGMVDHPAEYPWSSYLWNGAGQHSGPLVLKPQTEYLRMGLTPAARQGAYRTLFDTPLDGDALDSIRRAINGNYVLGNQRFRDEVAGMLNRRVAPGAPGRPVKVKAG